MGKIKGLYWIFAVGKRAFGTLRSAKKVAEEQEELAIYLCYMEHEEILYQYNPMSEKLERVQTVAQAKAKLKEKHRKDLTP